MSAGRRYQKVTLESIPLSSRERASYISVYGPFLSLEQQAEESVVIEIRLFNLAAVMLVEFAKQIENNLFFAALVHLSWPFQLRTACAPSPLMKSASGPDAQLTPCQSGSHLVSTRTPRSR